MTTTLSLTASHKFSFTNTGIWIRTSGGPVMNATTGTLHHGLLAISIGLVGFTLGAEFMFRPYTPDETAQHMRDYIARTVAALRPLSQADDCGCENCKAARDASATETAHESAVEAGAGENKPDA